MGLFATGLSVVSAGFVYATAPSASAAFTGSNGPIAFVSTGANCGSFGGIFEVNSQASGLGNASGDQAATSELTNGGSGAGVDAEPFFAPSGSEVFFSSNRDSLGVWAIYGIS
jgi:hypothetical protein